MKKLIFVFSIAASGFLNSQTLFNEAFSSQALSTYTSGSTAVEYTTVPTGFELINDGKHNSASANNTPFNVPSLKTAGWAVAYNTIENDTFLVGTSWLDTAQTVSRWVVTPPVANIGANTVITWLAKSPDAAFPESYEVYATNKTGSLTANDFTIGDRLLVVNDEESSWTRHSINLSAFSGQTLRFAFKNISSDKFQIWIDDLAVLTLTNSIDAGLTSLSANKYFLTNSAQTISAYLRNNGASALNTVSLNYKYGTSGIFTQSFTITSLGYDETIKLTMPQSYALSSAGNYPVKVWVSAPNNSADQNATNDTLYLNVTAQQSVPPKTILVEQFVSAMDGESVDAQEKLKSIESASVIVVNIHDKDSLKENNSSGILTYRKRFATALIDRAFDDSLVSFAIPKTNYYNRIERQLNTVSPASVTIINKNYNSLTRELSFTVKADFTGDAKGDYRFNAYLTERHVHGVSNDTSVNGINQLSNYFNVPWSPYYQQGYYSASFATWVLKPSQYKHHNVLIHAFDQSFGTGGIIPQNGGTAGQSYQQTFTLTLPTSTNGVSIYNADNIFVTGFVVEYGNTNIEKRIINAAQEKLTAAPELVGLAKSNISTEILLYPNPAKDKVMVRFPDVKNYVSVHVYDVNGKQVISVAHKAANIIELNTSSLIAGIYLVELRSENGISRKKLVIEK